MDDRDRLKRIESLAVAASVGVNGCSLDQGRAIYQLLERERPKRVIEIGLGYGISAMFIACGLRGQAHGRHVIVDPFQMRDFGGQGLANLERAGLRAQVDFYEESSHRVLPTLEREGFEVDFAFVDGSHLFDYTLVEFFYIDRMLKPGGLIVFDDAQVANVRKVLRFAQAVRGYEEMSSGPLVPLHRVAPRRLKRLRRGLAAIPESARFAVAGERRELLQREIGRPRAHSFGIVRKPMVDVVVDWRDDQPF